MKNTLSNCSVAVDFHFVILTKSNIGSVNVARNRPFMLANLMYSHIVNAENTRISKSCAWVFSMHIKFANISTFILRTYSELILIIIKTTKKSIKMTDMKRPFSPKFIVFFTVYYDVGSPPCLFTGWTPEFDQTLGKCYGFFTLTEAPCQK